MSSQQSKLVSTLVDEQHIVFQYVITVCDNAAQQCPAFPGRAKVPQPTISCVYQTLSWGCEAAHAHGAPAYLILCT